MSASELGAVHLVAYGPPAFNKLRGIVSLLKRDDPFAPVTVVVPTRYASIALRRRLASEGGIANAQFMTISDLAGVLGESSAASDDGGKLTPHLEVAAIRKTGDGVDAGSALGPVRDHPKLQTSLRGTFRELERVSERELRRIEQEDSFRYEIVRWFERYRGEVASCHGDERLAVDAAQVVITDPAAALYEIGDVVLYQLSALSPGETRLTEALYRTGRCTVIAGLLGDDAADESTRHLVTSLGLKATPASRAAELEGAERAEMRIVSAPDAAEEIRSVVRSIVGRAEAGVPFHRCAVLFGQPEPYAKLIAGQLDLAGIPAAGPVRVRLRDTPPGKLVDLLLKAFDDDLSRTAVLRWVAEAPVKDPNTGGAAYDELLLWERISADAGIVRGSEQWLDRLDLYCKAERRRIDSYTEADEVSPVTVDRHRRQLDSASRLREFIGTLAEDSASLATCGFRDSAVRWKALLRKYAHDPDSWPQTGGDALRALEEELDEVGGLGARFPEFGRIEFGSHMEEALGRRIGTLGALGTGVFVGPLDQAQCMEFDTLHIVGVAEGALPRRTGDDPVLPDRLFSRLVDGRTMTRASEREAQERRSFLGALAAGGSVVLSYPRTEPGAQREQYPSPWLLETAHGLHGEPVTSDELTRHSGEAWLTVIESVQHGLDVASESGAADAHDYDLVSLHAWSRAGMDLRSHYLAAGEPLSGALRMEEQRLSRRFTAWDGDVSSVAAESRRLSRQRGGVLSPTGLERWAACPYRYFLGDVLRVSALDAPADELSISPMDKGSLVHDILELFMRKSLEGGDVPRPGESWSDGSRDLLLAIAAREFDRAEMEGKTGRRLLWRLAREEILEDLDRFLAEDAEWRTEGWTPAAVEQRFGDPERGQLDAARVVLPDGGEVMFRGMIDRVDLSRDGSRAVVIDYKTGGSSSYRAIGSDPVDRGRRLQLPAYAAAVRAARDFPDRVDGFFWFVTTRGDFKKIEVDPEAADVMERFESVVATASSGIAAGIFPARPGPRDRGSWENCRYCDFDRICPTNRLRVWDSKKRNAALADYTELSGDVVEDGA